MYLMHAAVPEPPLAIRRGGKGHERGVLFLELFVGMPAQWLCGTVGCADVSLLASSLRLVPLGRWTALSQP